MQPESGIKTWQWVVTVIVIIALIIIGISVFGGKSSEAPITDDTASTTTQGVDVNRIVMGDQFPGNQVFVSSVQLVNPAWIVIHKDNAGQPGDVIGYGYYSAGINPGGKITLTSPTVEGGIYYAMLHSDDGDKKFDIKKDLPLKDAKGNIIMKTFRASASVSAGLKG